MLFWFSLLSVGLTVPSARRLDKQTWSSCSWPAVFHHLSESAVPGLNSVAWGRLLAAGLQGAALGLNRVAKNSPALGAAQCSHHSAGWERKEEPWPPSGSPSLGGSAALRRPAHRSFERQICGSSAQRGGLCHNQSISTSTFELFCKIKMSDID